MSLGHTPQNRTYIKGRKFGIGRKNELMSNGLEVSPACVDCSIVVANQDANTSTVTIQLKDAKGNDIDFVEIVDVFVFANAAGTAIATTGGSTGLAIGTDGAILSTVTAKKYFVVSSEADGDIDFTWTDTGLAETAFVGVRLPNGRVVVSSTLVTA